MPRGTGTGRKISPYESKAQTERDLWVYCMSKPEKYLAFFRRAYTDAHDNRVRRSPGLVLSWHWPAFFFSFIWLLYRKQYALGLGFYAVNAGINVLIPGTSWHETVLWLATKAVVAINARPVYVEKAVRKIRAARMQRIPAREWEAHLQDIGGVSYLAALTAVLLWAGIVIFLLRLQYG